ncbi:MAG: alkaline phosphatase [Planctomycetes bacterium]|nr:alkaline phosphatase [Planctomycetota bacterium]
MHNGLRAAVIFVGMVSGFSSCSKGGSAAAPDTRIKKAPPILAWRIDPISGTRQNRELATVDVAVLDGDTLEIDGSSTLEISLRIESPTNAATLSGETQKAATSGIARFGGLRVDTPGNDYRLIASTKDRPDVERVASSSFTIRKDPQHVIVMVADGWGNQQLQATRSYTNAPAPFDDPSDYVALHVSNFSLDTIDATKGGYDIVRAWNDIGYLVDTPTDSAASSTAMFCGLKTRNGRIAASADGLQRYRTIAEEALSAGYGCGAVTTVPISHATIGAFLAHNTSRLHGYAIADEMLFGDPNTTGTASKNIAWSGGLGPSTPSADVILGSGHPSWYRATNNIYVSPDMIAKLRLDTTTSGPWRFFERETGHDDAGARLLTAASDPQTSRLTGVWGSSTGNMEYARADGSGLEPENPTLAQMTEAALLLLTRNTQRDVEKSNGFVLVIEGGAIDWACHDNRLGEMIGEMREFHTAIERVEAWVDEPLNDSDWQNTLLIVTGDHETGLLSASYGSFPGTPIGRVDSTTLALEKQVKGRGTRASWDDTDNDDEIDSGEIVHWVWQSLGHSNQLVPLYLRGKLSSDLSSQASLDPVRGAFVDNTALYGLMRRALGL